MVNKSIKWVLSALLSLSVGSIAHASNWSIVAQYPHAHDAFTQGLSYHDGYVYETTGQYGASRLLRYQLGDETPEIIHRLHRRYFGEGSIILNNEAIWLSWQRGIAFAVDLTTGERRRAFTYQGEGWGLALSPDKSTMVMSNGSDTLQFLTPTGETVRTVRVTGAARRWDQLNELEWVNGTIFANRWHTQQILAIDAQTGRIKALFDFGALWDLQAEEQSLNRNMSFNGIAYRADTDTFLVTGKYWNQLFEVTLEGWQ